MGVHFHCLSVLVGNSYCNKNKQHDKYFTEFLRQLRSLEQLYQDIRHSNLSHYSQQELELKYDAKREFSKFIVKCKIYYICVYTFIHNKYYMIENF